MIRILNLRGCQMLVNDQFSSHRLYIDNGFNYEIHVRRELERILPAARVFWDIGANAGLHTVSAKQINPTLQVYCFEPAPINHELLLRTIGLNKWNDVFVMPVAIGGRVCIVGINSCPDNPCIGAHSDSYPKWVQMYNLDSFDFPLPDVVKIDIEGFELDALSSATKLLKKRPVIISEYNTVMLAPRNHHIAYADFLIQNGYRITSLEYQKGMRRTIQSGKELYQHIMATSGHITDILCEP